MNRIKKLTPTIFFALTFLLIINLIEPPKSLTDSPWKTVLLLTILLLLLISLVKLVKSFPVKRGFRAQYQSRIPKLSRLEKQR